MRAVGSASSSSAGPVILRSTRCLYQVRSSKSSHSRRHIQTSHSTFVQEHHASQATTRGTSKGHATSALSCEKGRSKEGYSICDGQTQKSSSQESSSQETCFSSSSSVAITRVSPTRPSAFIPPTRLRLWLFPNVSTT